MRLAAAVVLLSATGVWVAVRSGAQEPPTLILHGGPIYTAADEPAVVDALAVRGARIVDAGPADRILRLRGPGTEVVNLEGAAAFPGFHDAHGHFAALGARRSMLDLTGRRSAEAIAALVRERAAATPPGQWIAGRGWDQNDWSAGRDARDGGGWPARDVLDRAAPDHPVFLTRIDGHAAWVNTRALQLAGITPDTGDPPGGRIIRDGSGAPTGILIDRAQDLVRRRMTAPGRAARRAEILAADEECRRLGLTMVHDAGTPASTIDLYRELVAGGRLTTRLYVMLASQPDTTEFWFARGPLIDPAHQLTVRAVKLVADGALGSRGAALLDDYADEPGNRGLLVTPAAELEAVSRAAIAAGFQPCTHAIGDRANRIVLDIYERALRDRGETGALRPRIEHAQVLDAADISRFGALGVIASIQPTHCTSDMPWAPARLGDARIAEGAYPWRALLDRGAVLAAGSDFPVEPADPLLGFYAAITRQAADGTPHDGWSPAQRLTRAEALRAFTRDAAFAAHAERDLGTLEPGRLADIVVLSRDIMTMPPAGVLQTHVVRTIVGGRTVYRRVS